MVAIMLIKLSTTLLAKQRNWQLHERHLASSIIITNYSQRYFKAFYELRGWCLLGKVFAVDPSVLKETIYGQEFLAGDKKGVCGIAGVLNFKRLWMMTM